MNSLEHLKKILIHKWWVFYYCCKCGLIWQGLKHDMSKFSPTEFLESIKYYKGIFSPIDACKKENGYSMAWQHHKGRNPHHYEYWTDNYDSGTTCIKMPYKYATEMFCDYIGAAHAYMGEDFSWKAEIKWWKNKRSTAKMHPKTQEYIDRLFMYCYMNQRFPTKMDMEAIWDRVEMYE